ncbi:MAG TPA: hypothetical protein VLE73_04080 [Candidatus Saccharimonadales bacterium]|nr:hypothetical protein [Candidatus Saccharimonadales bacterium]
MKKNPLLEEANAIAASVYEIADVIEAELPDEKWRTVSKLKGAANDAYFYVAQVAGAGQNQAFEFDCVNAQKYLNTVKAMYIFAAKQGMTELDPELVVKIDKLVAETDAAWAASQKETKRKTEEDLRPWLEKYRIWQKISND